MPEASSSLPALTASDLDDASKAGVYHRVRFERWDHVRRQHTVLRRTQWTVIGLLVVLGGLVAAYVHVSQEARVIPYVVEVDRHGNALTIGPASELNEPDRRIITHHLVLWITRARTVTRDAALQRREIMETYDLTSGRAVGLLNDWYRERKPFALAEKQTITVTVDEDVESVLALDDSLERWRIQWTETIRTRGGSVQATELWQALVTIQVDPPDRLDEVTANPLGIYVTDFDWTRLSTN